MHFKKRNRVLRSKPPVAILQIILPKIDKMIYSFQQELAAVSALKAGAIWRGNGERSARYLKQIHQQMTAQQYMASLQSPAPIDPNAENICTSDPDLMNSYAQQYYQMLYSVDTVEPTEIINYLDGINFDRILPVHEAEFLEAENFLNELMAQTNRVKKSSSPGVDGLGYPFLALLFRMPCLKQIVLDIYNDVLKGIIPSSWQDIRARLLQKKAICLP
ncbi:hypothetical protein EDC94DRAFT_89312 [Helicostylum pulchrum]|nr:hypothetical protein EDC94DRAFT_89312 [Helicostylum pulchrum]